MTFTPSEHRPLRDSEWNTPESCSCGTWDVQNEFRTWEQHVDELQRQDREKVWAAGAANDEQMFPIENPYTKEA